MEALTCEECKTRFSTLGRRNKAGILSCPMPTSKMHPKYCGATCRQLVQNRNYRKSLETDPQKRQKDKDMRNKSAKAEHRVEARKAYSAANRDKQRQRYERFWSDPAKAQAAKEKQRQYAKANREALTAKDVAYRKQRKQNDPAFRVVTNLRNRVYSAVMAVKAGKKTVSGAKLLGCSPEFLVKHLEDQFLPGMSWENYGLHGWHVDHVRPVASFSDPQDPNCWHYTNLQPLWAEDNRRKSDKWEPATMDA